MNKLIVVFLVLLAVQISDVISATMGTLILSGSIPSRTSIMVVSETIANNLDLTAAQTDLLVGTAYESNNTKLGYTVALTSTNKGKLVETDGDFVAYTLKYNDISVDMSSVATVTDALGGRYKNVAKSIKISHPSSVPEDKTAGVYTDIITLSIAVK